MPRKKRLKPAEEMHDRELAEHLFGKKLVKKLHEEFDLRDTSQMPDKDFPPLQGNC